jgi:hypothetical protein
MATSSNKSSQNSLSSRKPFEPISHVWEIPAALYECRQLAIDGKNLALLALLESIIRVAGVDRHTWSKLPQMAIATGE